LPTKVPADHRRNQRIGKRLGGNELHVNGQNRTHRMRCVLDRWWCDVHLKSSISPGLSKEARQQFHDLVAEHRRLVRALGNEQDAVYAMSRECGREIPGVGEQWIRRNACEMFAYGCRCCWNCES
jgi:hypothetical protein